MNKHQKLLMNNTKENFEKVFFNEFKIPINTIFDFVGYRYISYRPDGFPLTSEQNIFLRGLELGYI